MGKKALFLLAILCTVAARPASGAFNLRGSGKEEKGGKCTALWVTLITAFGEEVGPARLEHDDDDATAYELARAALGEFEELKGVSAARLWVSDGKGKVIGSDQNVVAGVQQGRKKDSPLFVHMPPAVMLNLREEGMELSLAVEFATEEDFRAYLTTGEIIHIQKAPPREKKLNEDIDDDEFQDKPLARIRTLRRAVEASQVPGTYLMFRERVVRVDQV